ncbi:MAG: PilZ domain-containing protein [Deltaproteobacteria bacterium]|jgi:hypothetical protein|nr:PilZ domain-containing protein [Deltaproteobacteria bacterium]
MSGTELENSDIGRRVATRVQLDQPCFALLHVLETGAIFQVMLIDLSLTGAQLLFPPQFDPAEIPDKATLMLDSFPPGPMAMLDNIRANMVWRGLSNCGILFNYPLQVPLEMLVGKM